MREAVGAHLVDHVLDRAVDRTHRDDERLGVAGFVGSKQTAGLTAEAPLEFGRELLDQGQRAVLLEILQVAHLGEGVGADHRADRDRIGGIEALHRLVGRQEGVDRGLVGHVDALDRMGQDEAVDADHRRHRQFLGQAEGDDMKVGRLLVGLGEELDPAGFA